MNAEDPREDHLVAGLCHLGVLLPMVGAVVPLGIWLTQRNRSRLLRFQALQALAYQVVGILATFLVYACQMLSGFSAFLLMPLGLGASSSRAPGPDPSGLGAALGLVVFALMLGGMLVAILQCLGAPLFAALGVWGAWRVLAGHDFRYPLLGQRVAAWLKREQAGRGGTTPAAPAGQEQSA